MEKLLEKVKEYGKKNNLGEPSLCLESNGSGFIHYSVYEIEDIDPYFEFNTLDELYIEVGYNLRELVVYKTDYKISGLTASKTYEVIYEGIACYEIEDDNGENKYIYKRYLEKL